MGEEIIIDIDDYEVVSVGDYSYDMEVQFPDLPDVAKPVLENAKKILLKLEKMLYVAPAFIEIVKSTIPEQVFQVVLSDSDKEQLSSGALELMTRKDGAVMATLKNPKTNRIVSHIPIESVDISPDITETMTDYITQMQLAQIAEEIHTVQLAIEEVRMGQEFDRLAIAYSCQQRLIQAVQIERVELRDAALLGIVSDAENSRNMLMQSQYANLRFIKSQPESTWGKLTVGASTEKINQRLVEIRDNLSAVNMVSLVEALAYRELGEPAAARQSLLYYADYLQKAYLDEFGLVERLDLIDPSPENYWSKILPDIHKKIQNLPCVNKVVSIGRENDEEKRNGV